MSGLSYAERSPDPAFRRSVECFWKVTVGELPVEDVVAPDGCLDIVFSPSLGLRVVGAMTRAQSFALPPNSTVVGVRFRPGMARRAIGATPSEFTDLSVDLAAIWGKRGCLFESRMRDANCPEERWLLMLREISRFDYRPSPIQRAVEAFAASGGRMKLSTLAFEAGLSARHFRRRCLEETGLAPKQLARILRFRFARALAAASTHPDWAAIATEAGYFDQPHLIRDWRELLGHSPEAST